MRFRSLAIRIVAIFLAMSLLGQLAGFFVIKSAINENARISLSEELSVGEQVVSRFIEQNTHKLTLGSSLVATDPVLHEAISRGDEPKIKAMLATSGKRIGATVTILVHQDGSSIVGQDSPQSSELEIFSRGLLPAAELNGASSAVTVVNGEIFQIVVSPVRGASGSAQRWIVVASPINLQVAREIRRVSSLHVSLAVSDKEQKVIHVASTLPSNVSNAIVESALIQPGAANIAKIREGEFSTREVMLYASQGVDAYIVLSRSVSAAIEPYRMLQLTLLILTVSNIIIIVAGSVFTAKRITGPLRSLSLIAQRMGNGNFDDQIEIKTNDELGDLARAFLKMRDRIAQRESEINRLAYMDPVTGLPNRHHFTRSLIDAIAAAEISKTEVSVLLMDLDRFKHVNDVLGHVFGDSLLKNVGARLGRILNAGEQIARLGGDEFAILLPETSAEEAKHFASLLLKSLEEPLVIEGNSIDVGAGIGIACFPVHGTSPHVLLSHAEMAMYVAKRSGNEATIFTPSIDSTAIDSLSLLSDLRRAIDDDQFKLYVQPKLCLDTGSVIGVESLLRWAHPVNGMIFPDKFIPFAEKTGFIRVMTLWVLDQSALLARRLLDENVTCKVSVNLSARDLLDQDLPTKFLAITTKHGVPASAFCLEITESTIMDDPVRAQQTLEALHALGVDLSIDDFGTGYSSLAYLKRLPVDEIKIDKSFVMNMEHDIDDTKIVRSTIDLGHNMGLRVVAEGVENEATWLLLKRLGCDQAQGYFMSRPMPAEKLLPWISGWTPPGQG